MMPSQCLLLLRFLLTVLALSATLAAPAFAVSLVRPAPAPCHEAMGAQAGVEQGMHQAMAGESGPLAQPHLCCALACLMTAPPLAMGSGAAMRGRMAWAGVERPALTGRVLPIPKPPPRRFS